MLTNKNQLLKIALGILILSAALLILNRPIQAAAAVFIGGAIGLGVIVAGHLARP